MNKLEQRLYDLTKQLASARNVKDEALIEDLEDEIAEVEDELEEQYSSKFDIEEDY